MSLPGPRDKDVLHKSYTHKDEWGHGINTQTKEDSQVYLDGT